MEEYTNKYMQVFDTYDDFAQHSADYVKGEDHIAYLIQENEVIYWLYLEQVWRPLNVRTTTTGQLEDGRTKVAVRLEYIEGSQKYTSVPNIPDPERITSMSRFLEDYPDIEEVNVTGTVNLTDLSYAFAGSKIRDFSKLDTSNVTTINNIFENVENEENDFILNIPKLQGRNDINAKRLHNIIINKDYDIYRTVIRTNQGVNECYYNNITINFNNYNKEDDINSLIDTSYDINKGLEIMNETRINYAKAPCIKVTDNTLNCYANDIEADIIIMKHPYNIINQINIITDKLYIGFGQIDNKIICDKIKEIILVKNNTSPYRLESKFGCGIKFYNDTIFTIKNYCTIGNFIFTVPIVNDAFYAKYNYPISIFQYKTTFEEVADVKITEATDSSLIYVDWGSIDFDTSEMSIEMLNSINLSNCNQRFKKIIIDNRNLNLDYNSYPNIDDQPFLIRASEGYISGNFKSDKSEHTFWIYDDMLFSDVIIWDASTIYIQNCSTTIFTDKNIKFNHGNDLTMPTLRLANGHLNVNNLAIDNVVECGLVVDERYSKILFDNNVKLNIIGNSQFYVNNILEYINTDNVHQLTGIIRITDANEYINDTSSITHVDNIYLNGMITLTNFYTRVDNGTGALANIDYAVDYGITNIYGENINIQLPFYDGRYSENTYVGDEDYNHIDISITYTTYPECDILVFINSDEETTINLITKLTVNTNTSPFTIYMYRSQANIIGDDNIAAAVAKNYEFAIIEN